MKRPPGEGGPSTLDGDRLRFFACTLVYVALLVVALRSIPRHTQRYLCLAFGQSPGG